MDHQRQPNPNVPPLVADAFVSYARQQYVIVTLNIDSLITSLNSLLDSEFFADTETQIHVPELDKEFDIVSAAAAYIGQTLALNHNGLWTGFFALDSLTNFYTAKLTFGAYSIHPICWLSYRLTNGSEEGSVSDWLGRVLPSIIARKDLTPPSGFIDEIT